MFRCLKCNLMMEINFCIVNEKYWCIPCLQDSIKGKKYTLGKSANISNLVFNDGSDESRTSNGVVSDARNGTTHRNDEAIVHKEQEFREKFF